jgi:hypothetical protein
VTAFARPAESDPRGKLDERIDTPVPTAVKDDAAFVARAEGYSSTSEWVRNLIYRELYGRVNHIQTIVRGAAAGDGRNVP